MSKVKLLYLYYSWFKNQSLKIYYDKKNLKLAIKSSFKIWLQPANRRSYYLRSCHTTNHNIYPKMRNDPHRQDPFFQLIDSSTLS